MAFSSWCILNMTLLAHDITGVIMILLTVAALHLGNNLRHIGYTVLHTIGVLQQIPTPHNLVGGSGNFLRE